MNKTTQLYLVRHAETTTITEKRIHGQTDGPISEKGLRDAHKAADYFRGQHFDAFYASSLGRAMRTAEIIGDAIKQTPQPVDNLQERYYGHIEGKSLDLFEPDGSGLWILRPYVSLMLWLTGEREKDFIQRITNSIEEIITRHQGQKILVVTHWGVISILSLYFQGKDFAEWRKVGPWTACGVSEYHKNGSTWDAVRVNDGSYLL